MRRSSVIWMATSWRKRRSSQVTAVALLALLMPVSAAGQASLDADARAELEEIVPAILDSMPVSGMAVGVVIGDSLVYARGFGVADLETRAPITSETLFQVGSISKSFTATLAATLSDRGLLGFDDLLARHLPHATLPDSAITLRQLAEHTSGLPRDAPGLRRLHGDYPVLAFTHFELYRGLAESELLFAPDSGWSYSNFGYGVLGHVLEMASGTPYEVLLEREILEPLGMASSTVTIWPELADRLATPHSVENGRLAEYTPWDPEALAPASGVASSVTDMGRYVAFQIAAALAGGTLRDQQRPRHRVNDVLSSGRGWFVEEVSGVGEVVSVGGDLDGYVAEIAFSPEHQVGTVILAATDPAGPIQDLGRWLLASALASGGDEAARESRYRRGMIHQGLREWSAAVARFEELAEGPDPHLRALYQLGRTGAISGERLAGAEGALRRYLSTEGPLPISRDAAQWRLGNVYEEMGRCRDAEREYRRSAEAGYVPAQNALRRLSCEEGPPR